MTVGDVALPLLRHLIQAKRQRDAWCSIALSALEALAEARRELDMIDGTLARKHAADAAERWRAVDAAYDGQSAADRREIAA